MLEIACRCGQVRATLDEPSPRALGRTVCYCADCQAFAHHLGRADLLDARGGSDIVPLAPASLVFHQGRDRIAAVRLSPKGVHRFYATCCHTPLGNTVGPKVPFVGLLTEAFEGSGQKPDEILQPPVGAIFGEHAIGGPPPGSKGVRLGFMLTALLRMIGWRIAGRVWPHPFFDRATRKPLYPVKVLTREERDALRPFCGPAPSRAAASA